MTIVRGLLLLLCACGVATAYGQELEETLGEIVVTGIVGSESLTRTSSPVSVASRNELDYSAYTNVIDAVAQHPVVALVTTGSGISKPVIRGLGYNRIVVINDGMRQEGQQWGDEHGIEIDAQSVGSVEIMKGPASLMYGSDAMAGVLIFHDAHDLPEGEIEGSVSGEYQSNAGLYGYSVDAAGHEGRVVWDLRFSDKSAGDYSNSRDGRVENSGFAERAASALVGVDHAGGGYSRVKLGYYSVRPEIVGEEGYQRVAHYKAVSDNAFDLRGGVMKLLVGYQQNRRREYEDPLEDCELDMLLHTVNYDCHWLARERNGWKWLVGMNGMGLWSRNCGEEYLIPDYDLFDWGMFATASKTLGAWSMSGGLRYDLRAMSGRELIEDEEERFAAFSRLFTGVTGSVGVSYGVGEHGTLRANLARGFRTPNISELASNGVHEGTYRYEVGSSTLSAERSWQFDLGADYSLSWLQARVALFANWIDNYIFSERMLDETGEAVECEGYDVYGYLQGDARLMGGELEVDVHPWRSLHFENTLAYVSAVLRGEPTESRYLPLTPAPRWLSTLRYMFVREGRWLRGSFAALSLDYNFAQNHYYAANGTETATPAYCLLNASMGTTVVYHSRPLLRLTLMVNNLTNRAYVNHLSRLKYTSLEDSGREGIYNMGRNVVVKAVVPLHF